MPIVVECECGKKYKVGDDKAGKKLRCKACEAVLTVPAPEAELAAVDEFDDFGDLGDYAAAEPARPARPPSGKSGKGRSKAGKKKPGKKGAGKKGGARKGGSNMSPVVKYSICGGIVVVTAGIIIGILYARGMIGGGKKHAGPSGASDAGSATSSGDLVSGNPSGRGNPPSMPGAAPNVKQPVQPKQWTLRKEWTPNPALLSQLGEPQPLKDFSEYRFRVPKVLQPAEYSGKLPPNAENATLYMWTKSGSSKNSTGLALIVRKLPPGQTLKQGAEQSVFQNQLIKAKQNSSSFVATKTQSGKINGIAFQRQSYEVTVKINGRTETMLGFMYVGADQNRTCLIAFIASDYAANAADSLPIFETAVLSFHRKDTMSDEPAPKQSHSSSNAVAALDLLTQNPPGNTSQKGKTIRVEGTVAKPWNQGWIFLTGDGTRSVACQFAAAPAQKPAVGETIVVEGTFNDSAATYISLLKSKLVQDATSSDAAGKGAKQPAPTEVAVVELLKRYPPGAAVPKSKTVRVKGTVAKPWEMGWIVLQGDGNRAVGCRFANAPAKQPAAGESIVVEGTLGLSKGQFVTLENCRLVQAKAKTEKGPLGNRANGKKSAGNSKHPVVLSNAKVRFARNNWLIQVDYKFTKGVPAPNDWYFFTVTVPGNHSAYQPMKGSSLRQQGTLRLRNEVTKGQPTTGEVSITVFHGKSRNRSAGRPVANTLKVKVGEPSSRSEDSAATDVVAGRLIRSWKHNVATKEDKNAVMSLAFSPDGKALAAGGRDGMVKLWDPATGRNIASWKGHSGFVNAVAFHPTGTLVASGGEDRRVRLWDVKSGRNVATLKGHDGGVTSVAFTRDGKILVSSGGSSIIVWDVATRRKARSIDVGALQGVRSLAVHSDGVTLATSGDGVRLWDLKTGKSIAALNVPANGPGGHVESVAFSPDGKFLAAGTFNSKVFVWDAKTRNHTATLGTAGGDNVFEPISAIAFSPNGKRLASVPVKPVVGIWNVESRRLVGTLTARSTLTCVAYSPDGKTVATGDALNNIMLWDASKFGGK